MMKSPCERGGYGVEKKRTRKGGGWSGKRVMRGGCGGGRKRGDAKRKRDV